ncbi:hypothetical protein [Herbiconiux sp.]|uniref:hypothetical protein n=1 Tax=Herbiconiux sp. TaxID=1871186 RepID=UPI0025C30817|nr:hypothetical protein [Herbiconiux sp.]
MRRADTISEPRVPVVGGYTLTEVLSVGERANVFAAVAAREPPSVAARSVVVKVRLGGAGTSVRHARFATASHLAELEALSARPIAAMPRLIEVVSGEEGRPALVLSRCEGRPLGDVLGASGHSDDSVVRAVGAAVRQLHEAGWAHGGLDPGSVLVGPDAGVTLVGFGRAVARGAPGFDEAVGRDSAWVSRLARTPGRTVGADDPRAGLGEEWAWADERASVPAAGEAPRVAETVDPALVAVGEFLRAVRAAPGGWARRLPRRVFAKAGLAAVLVAVVVTAVVVLMPGGEPAEGGGQGTVESDGAGVAAGGGTDGDEVDGDEADGDEGSGGGADGETDSAVRGDDPVAATAALLRVRATCFAAGDAACLDGVDQWGSPALAADLEEMQGDSSERRMLPADPGAGVLRLVQRVGDFALVEVTGPGTAAAPLLVVRGGAGWRLRSYGPVGP